MIDCIINWMKNNRKYINEKIIIKIKKYDTFIFVKSLFKIKIDIEKFRCY